MLNIKYAIHCITGSMVVLTCCKGLSALEVWSRQGAIQIHVYQITLRKGDCQSQWKTPIFGPSQLGNPLFM